MITVTSLVLLLFFADSYIVNHFCPFSFACKNRLIFMCTCNICSVQDLFSYAGIDSDSTRSGVSSLHFFRGVKGWLTPLFPCIN